jgi:hypothetical protein
MADPIKEPDQGVVCKVRRIQEYRGRSHLQSEIDSKIVLAPTFSAITKADQLEVDPTVKKTNIIT